MSKLTGSNHQRALGIHLLVEHRGKQLHRKEETETYIEALLEYPRPADLGWLGTLTRQQSTLESVNKEIDDTEKGILDFLRPGVTEEASTTP